MNNKKIVIILMSLTIIFVTLGSTFAYLNWESADSRKTNVTFTVNPDFSCAADGGGDITSNDVELIPTDCTSSTYAIKRQINTSVTTTANKVVSLDLWLDINSISTNLSNSDNFKYVLSRSGNSCTYGVVTQGTFKNKQVNDQIQLLDGIEYATLDDIYYLYIWLDKAETNINTMNQSFNFSLGGTCGYHGLDKAQLKSLNTTNFFREADYKTTVTDIYFVYDEDLPSGIKTNNIKTYDMGQNVSRPITGYLIENTDVGADPDTYKVYISSEYKIYAGSLQNAFNGMSALKNISFDNFDTSDTTAMSDMFRSCSGLTTLDLTSFNTSKVTTMLRMFSGCSSLATVNVSYFNTSKVANMGEMFGGCIALTGLNLSGWVTDSLTTVHQSGQNYAGMFYNCQSLTYLDLSNFNMSGVTDFSQIFWGCNNLQTLILGSWDTSNATSMSMTFRGCTSLTYLDIRNWDISNVDSSNNPFYSTTANDEIYIIVRDETAKTWFESKLNGRGTVVIADDL